MKIRIIGADESLRDPEIKLSETFWALKVDATPCLSLANPSKQPSHFKNHLHRPVTGDPVRKSCSDSEKSTIITISKIWLSTIFTNQALSLTQRRLTYSVCAPNPCVSVPNRVSSYRCSIFMVWYPKIKGSNQIAMIPLRSESRSTLEHPLNTGRVL